MNISFCFSGSFCVLCVIFAPFAYGSPLSGCPIPIPVSRTPIISLYHLPEAHFRP